MKKSHLILFGLLLSFTVNATNDIPRPVLSSKELNG